MLGRWFCPICNAQYSSSGTCTNVIHFAICNKCDEIEMVRWPMAIRRRHKKCGGYITTNPQDCNTLLIKEGSLVPRDLIIEIMAQKTERAKRNFHFELDETHHRWLRTFLFTVIISIGIVLLVCGMLAMTQTPIPY